MMKDPRKKPDLSSLVYGKIPPQNIEVEAAILGAIMLECDRLDEVIELIPSEDVFYMDTHQKVYRAVLDLVQSGSKVDLLTVAERMTKSGTLEMPKDAYTITKLTSDVVSSAHIIDHAHIILNHWKLREVIRLCGTSISECYDASEDAAGILSKLESDLQAISGVGIEGATSHVSEGVIEVNIRIESLQNRTMDLIGIDTGLRELNRVTNGWKSPDLIILAARPARGKTALCLNLALNACESTLTEPTGVYIQSLEMSRAQLVQRLIAIKSGLDMEKIKTGNLNPGEMERVMSASAYIAKLPIYINDRAGVSINYIHAVAKRLKKKNKYGVKNWLVIIDYLQLCSVQDEKGKNREQQISEMSRKAKHMCKELEVPAIVLAQMNRKIEETSNRKPGLSDLRESGAIEQDADMAMFIHSEIDPNTNDEVHSLVIAKHRDGSTGDIPVKFIKANQKWVNRDDDTFTGMETASPFAGMPGYERGKQKTIHGDDDLPF